MPDPTDLVASTDMTDMLIESQTLADRLRRALPTDVDYASARLHDERSEHLRVRRNELEPIFTEFDTGVMISIWDGGGPRLRRDLRSQRVRARNWPSNEPATGPTITAGSMVTTTPPPDHAVGVYRSPVEVDWDTLPLDDRLELLHQQSRLLGIDDRIVDWSASLVKREVDTLLVTSGGGRIEQRFRFVYPGLRAVANEGTNTQVAHLRRRRVLRPGWRRGARTARVRRRRLAHRRPGARTPRRTELPERRDGPPARARPDDAADPRVDRPPARARPHPRRRAQLRRHELRHRRHVRLVPVRLRAAERHVRSDRAGPARQLRLRRRRHAGHPAAPDRERGPQARARRRGVPAAHRPRRGGQLAGIRLEPPADRPHGQPQRRAGRLDRSRS